MALKEILVHVDTAPSVGRRIKVAAALARTHGAVLTGLFVLSKPHIPEYIRSQMPGDFLDTQMKSAQRAAKEAERLFRELAGQAGVDLDWYCAEGNHAETLSLYGRYADLVVLGQRDPNHPIPAGAEELPVRPILTTGRPILLLPHDMTAVGVGKRIAIAWDASRLATRAVGDSLPFLQRAETVTILVVNPHGEPAGRGGVLGAAIRQYLARHGIQAGIRHIEGEPTEASRRLHDGAAEMNADLIVMGAYGHIRWRELVLGGVTAHMMRNSRVPVLMSH